MILTFLPNIIFSACWLRGDISVAVFECLTHQLKIPLEPDRRTLAQGFQGWSLNFRAQVTLRGKMGQKEVSGWWSPVTDTPIHSASHCLILHQNCPDNPPKLNINLYLGTQTKSHFIAGNNYQLRSTIKKFFLTWIQSLKDLRLFIIFSSLFCVSVISQDPELQS